MVRLRRVLLPAVCCVLSWHNLLAQAAPQRLNLVVVQGEGAANRIHSRAGQAPEVRVEDQDGQKVVGAVVVFTLPTSGASGEFDKGAKNLTVVTDEQGLAAAHGLKANDTPGKVAIHVNASYRGQTARATITEFNMAPDGVRRSGGSGKLIAILAIVGGAAAGGVFAATHKSGSSAGSGPSAPGTIVLTPGSGTVGAPH